MNFDFSDVLTRAWQMTWKNKVFWVVALLPLIPWLLFFPLVLIAFPWSDLMYGSSVPFDFPGNPASETLIGVGYFVILLLALVAQVFVNAALTLGVVRAEAGTEKQGFGEVFKASLPYIVRIFGAFLLIGIATAIFFAVFFACMSAVSFITMGIGSIFMQFFLYPIIFVIWIIAEQSQAAVIADDMNATEALGRAWDLLTSHIWKFLLIGIVVYIAQTIVSAIVSFPMIIPVWGFMYIISETAPRMTSLLAAMLCMVALMPFYMFVMGVSKTFTRSAFVLTYRRLTRDSLARRELLEAIASKESK